MKKFTKVTIAILTLVLSVFTFAGCQNLSSVYNNKYFDEMEEKNPTSLVNSYRTFTTPGNITAISEDSALLRSVDNNTASNSTSYTYTLYNLTNSTAIKTWSYVNRHDSVEDDIYSVSFKTILENTFVRVRKTHETNASILDSLYDLDGNLLISSTNGLYFNLDLIIDGDQYYRINSKGKIELIKTISQVSSSTPTFDAMNGNNYYIFDEDSFAVYNNKLEYVYYYEAPSYADVEGHFYVLNNGNVLIQYSYEDAEDSQDYNVINNNKKYKFVTLVFNVSTKKIEEKDCEYVFETIVSRKTIYNESSANSMNKALSLMFNSSVKNFAMAYRIENKKVDTSKSIYASIGNNLKVKVAVNEIFPAQEEIATPVKKGYYAYENKLGQSILVKSSGAVVGDISNAVGASESYIFSNEKVYDYNLNEVYSIGEDFTFVDSFKNNAIYRNDDVYYLYNGSNGSLTTIANNPSTVYSTVNRRLYVISDTENNTYTYYNENGDQICQTSKNLTYVGLCNGEDIFALIEDNATTYYAFYYSK